MYKIGDFSKISQVSIKTLHHYDDVGLLKPMHVDTTTGYRYYALDQLPRLNRILALKDLGFSLEQIASFLHGPLVAAELRSMLQLKRVELQRLVQEEQSRLNRVETRLHQIEKENVVPVYDIVLKSVAAQHIISGCEVVPSSEEMDHYCRALGIELFDLLASLGVRSYGPMLTLYHDNDVIYNAHNYDIHVEMGIHIDHSLTGIALPAASKISIRELPAVEIAASLIHNGDYDGLWLAYAQMLSWIDNNEYDRDGPFRFVYLRTPGEQGEAITELQFPVQHKRHAPHI